MTSRRSSRTPSPRRRNAAATRAAILRAARAAFARAGYDGAGVREIAADAGVTAMLINRYFGSKQQLFAEAIAEAMREPAIVAREDLQSSDLARRIAELVVESSDARGAPLDGFLAMLSSAASPAAARIGREQVERHYQAALAAALHGPHAAQRAGLILAVVAGVQAMRQMISLSALATARPQVLVDLLAPVFERLVGG